MSITSARAALIAAALATAIVVAGCGGGGDSGGSTSTATSGTASGSNHEAAQQVRRWEQAPTRIGVTTPLAQAPKPGQTFVYLQCEILQCQAIGKSIRAAVESVGWRYQQINFKQADPATLVAGMKQALKSHPVAVSFTGLPEAVWASMKPAYEKAGVAMIPQYVGPAKLDGPVIANINGPDDLEHGAEIVADWFILDSGGRGKALVHDVPQYPAVHAWATDFERIVKQRCPGCQVERVETTVAQVVGGGVTSAVVSALQRNRSLGYALTFNGGFFQGLPGALKNAGLAKVKVGGYVAVPQNVADIMNGSGGAFVGLNTDYGGWLAVDLALRRSLGATLPEDEQHLPVQLLTNGSATKAAQDFQAPAGYQQQFQALWKAAR